MFQSVISKYKNERLNVMFIAAVISFMISLILIVYLATSTKSRFENISDSWQNLHAGPETKGEYLISINGDMGYGGFIHKFKNYILRHDDLMIPNMQHDLANLRVALRGFQAAGVSSIERHALLEISNVVDEYEKKLIVAQDAVKQGKTISEIDKLTRVDDSLALQSLKVLQAIWVEDLNAGHLQQTENINQGLALQKYSFLILGILVGLGGLQIVWMRQFRLVVAERTKAERQLKSAVEGLKRSNQDLEQYANAASHDLQEPLRKILAFGGRLQNSYGDKLDDEARDYLARMRSAASRMQSLIINLLEYSRVTSKAKPFQPIDLNHVLSQVKSNLESTIEETSAEVEGISLPVIDADPMQIQQLFQNLVSNSLKYRSEGRKPQIYIEGKIINEADAETGYAQELCRIEFRDNGIGFDPKYTDKIFEIFQRLHGREKYQGSGVGLAICRKIVEHHKGTISASSVEGEGTVFLIKLPVHQLICGS